MSWTNSKVTISQEQKQHLNTGMGLAAGPRNKDRRAETLKRQQEARQKLLDRFNKKNETRISSH